MMRGSFAMKSYERAVTVGTEPETQLIRIKHPGHRFETQLSNDLSHSRPDGTAPTASSSTARRSALVDGVGQASS